MSIASTSRRHGFTLIELMIAVGLGMLVVLTVMSAFRVAVQSTTIANRLSLENAVMRAGLRIARDEVDFWTGVDDPDNASLQRLRPPGVSPFASAPAAFTDMSTRWSGALNDSETNLAYDPRDTAWAVGNPRSWWRGNMAEKLYLASRGAPSDLRFGRYGIFANRSTTLSSYFKTNTGTVDASGVPITIDYGPVQVPHTWLFNQIERFHSMGHYAMVDYLPANAIFCYYEPYVSGTTSQGGYRYIPRISDGWQGQPLGRSRATANIAIALPDPRNGVTASDLANFQRSGYGLADYWVTYMTGKRSSDQFYRETAYPNPVIVSGTTAPESWPGLTVRVHRFIQTSRIVTWARISLVKPLTGEQMELSFTSFGTTLRGARQQRRSGGGWANWDNAVGASNDTTLDGAPVQQ